MRPMLALAILLLFSATASAACRCTCVLGQMRPVCQPTDLMVPICQGICADETRPEIVVRPLAGGQQAFNPPVPFDPAQPTVTFDPRTGQVESGGNYDLDTRGFPVGTAGVPSGTTGLSSGAVGAVGR